jgi:acetate kinase
MPSDILTINQGLSSLKFAIFEVCSGNQIALQFRGEVDSLHGAPCFRVLDAAHQVMAHEQWCSDETGNEPAYKRLL